jgi:hypothetical protein
MLTQIDDIASTVASGSCSKCLNLKVFVWNLTERVTLGVRMGESSMRPAVFITVLLFAGCASHGVHPLRALEIPTAPYNGIVTTALTGSLLYEGGCLLFRDDGKHLQLVPVWPDGTTFNGTSVIFHEPGKADQRIVVAEEFLMQGQPLEWRYVPGQRTVLHQRQCGGVPFAVLGIRPAN